MGPALKSSCGSSRQRHFYDEVQLALLDAEFTRDSFPNREGRRRIAQLIGVSEKSIMVWEFTFSMSNALQLIFVPSFHSGGFKIAVDVLVKLDQNPWLQLEKQIANIVEPRLTPLINANKVNLPLKFYIFNL